MIAPSTERSGFALLATLWIIIGISLLVFGAGNIGRRAVAVAQRDHDRIVGRWIAEGCLERVRGIVDHALVTTPSQADVLWRDADTVVLSDTATILAGCELSMRSISRVVLGQPLLDAWVVRARAHVGVPPTPVNIEIRLQRAGSRAAIMRWVEW